MRPSDPHSHPHPHSSPHQPSPLTLTPHPSPSTLNPHPHLHLHPGACSIRPSPLCWLPARSFAKRMSNGSWAPHRPHSPAPSRHVHGRHVCMHALMRMDTCMHACMHACNVTHIHMACTQTCTHTHTHARRSVSCSPSAAAAPRRHLPHPPPPLPAPACMRSLPTLVSCRPHWPRDADMWRHAVKDVASCKCRCQRSGK